MWPTASNLPLPVEQTGERLLLLLIVVSLRTNWIVPGRVESIGGISVESGVCVHVVRKGISGYMRTNLRQLCCNELGIANLPVEVWSYI